MRRLSENMKKSSTKALTRLNLGCGFDKREGFINVDKYSTLADVNADILKLPFKDNFADEVVLFHVIEHVPYLKHVDLLDEIFRVTKEGGTFYISFPEFEKCSKAFLENKDGQRWKWWVQTLYGEQSHPGLFHVAPILIDRLTEQLEESGFGELEISEDRTDTALRCKKLKPKNWV
jgi:ubiquinone/menaquinone biosynthesis C-methylase UbiE